MPVHATKTDGHIPVSDLGTGTPTGSKFLRDDGTWQSPPGGGGASWGAITGTLSSQTDLQSALDAKSDTGHNHTGTYQPLATVLTNTTASFTTAQETKLSGIASGAEVNVNADWNAGSGDAQILNKPTLGGAAALNVGTSAGTVSAGDHNHTGVYQPLATVLTNTTASFTTAQETKLSGIETGATADMTGAEIVAAIDTNLGSSAWQGGGGSSPTVATLASDQATGANTTPVTLTGLSFSYDANSTYRIWFMGRVSPAAATTGCGFQFDLSSAVTAINVMFVHQLANTGTLSGGHSIADDASVGVSSGLPGTSTYPVMGSGLLVTGANTGTAQLRFRSETTAVTTAKAGLTLVVEKVA